MRFWRRSVEPVACSIRNNWFSPSIWRNFYNSNVDIQKIVRQTVKDIGYTRAKYGFDGETVAVLVAIDEQSPDIAQGS